MASLFVFISILAIASPFLCIQGQDIFRDGDLRLVSNDGSTGGASGRLEVYYSFQWGTVCNDNIGANEALVACRQLGFSTWSDASAVSFFGFNEASPSTPTWLDNLSCSSSESRLIDCTHNGFGIEDCTHSQDLGLICSGLITSTSVPTTTVFRDGDLRLVLNDESTGGFKGRLEVYYSSQWGTVCDDRFGGTDATVACRQLGFASYTSYDSVATLGFNQGSSSSRTWLDELGCTGTESRLVDCSHNGFGNEDCAHFEDIGLICSNPAITDSPPAVTIVPPSIAQGDIRLVGLDGYTSGIAGRVEVYLGSQWMTVCDNTIEREVPDVVCRQLGFTGSAYYGTVDDLDYTTVSSSLPYLDDVFCSGFESRLEHCSHRVVFTGQGCSHSNDLAVLCNGVADSGSQSVVETGALRLNTKGVDNPRSFSGRLEVYVNGQWGTVCDDGFGSTEANSACRQLGFVGALYHGNVDNLNFNQPSNDVRIWLDGVGCSSDSPPPRLIQCTHNGIGNHDCSHEEDVALVCLGVGSLRLVGAPSSTSFSREEGRLEVYVNGQWGTVCDDSFDQTDAEVACQQLGFPRATGYDDVDSSSSYSTSPRIWLDDLNCQSDDDFLLLCDHRGIGVENCGHSEDIELTCSKLSSGAAIAIGIVVPAVVIAIIVIVVCCCCYHKKKKRVTNRTPARPLTRTVQPTTTAIITSNQNTGTAYPMQTYPTAPQQTYPVQQPRYSNLQGSAYPTQPQQPPLGYPAPYPTMQQQPPAPYPTMQQQPPAPYPPVQQQTVLGLGTAGAEPTKSDLYADAPPPYPGTAAELSAYPPYQPGGYPQTDAYPPPQ